MPFPGRCSVNEHRIAITEEAVALGDRFAVNAPLLGQAGQRGHQGDQGAAREMEIGDQAIHLPPAVWRVNENVGLPAGGDKRKTGRLGFQDAGGSGADGDDPAGARIWARFNCSAAAASSEYDSPCIPWPWRVSAVIGLNVPMRRAVSPLLAGCRRRPDVAAARG